MLLRLFVKILQGLAAGLLVLREIVVCPICHTLKLLHSERKLEFDVVRPLGVVRAFLGRNLVNMQKLRRNTDIRIKTQALSQPVLE